MTKMLLTCHPDDYDIATDLKITIEEQLAFKVTIYVEDYDEYDEDDSITPENDLEAELEGTTVLLVFKFDSMSISAWVMIEDEDERSFFQSKYEESLFPELIVFDRDDFSRGIRILEDIMVSDFGLVVRPSQDEEKVKQSEVLPPLALGCSRNAAGEISRELFGHSMDQSLRSRRDHEAIEAVKSSGKLRGMRIFRKVDNIFGKFKRRRVSTQ